MQGKRKWWKGLLALALAGIALQAAASLVVRTAAARRFLTKQLENSFGRDVEVRKYSASLFPTPQLDATAVSVGEDPAFGREYFLEAERLSAGFRWSGLLRGKFELGTLRLQRPSLILVRNGEGRWNLERWLPAVSPAAKTSAAALTTSKPVPPTHRLQKIEISDGRVNFKLGDDKIAFAFLRVQGIVEQVAEDRWRLDLESEPWRSGVPLQLVGTARLRGDVAGTSARLQPAHLQMSWEKSSLADIFRLIGGRDFGVRGTFAAEATADSGAVPPAESGDAVPGDWSFSLQARASGIHRWDLTEREDNPRLGIRAKGRWNPGLGVTGAQEIVIETPRSNLRGSGFLKNVADSELDLRFDSAGIQAADFLDWWRAFHPNVAEEIHGAQYFTGTARFRGWPPRLEEAAFSSLGGRWAVPGLVSPLVVRAVRGGTQHGRLLVDPFAVSVPGVVKAAGQSATAKEAAGGAVSTLNVSLTQDPQWHSGSLRIEGQVAQTESIFLVASALGHNLQHGWDLRGKAAGELRWEWAPDSSPAWTGHAEVTRAALEVVGLNQPVELDNLRANWDQGRRKFTLGNVAAFEGTWTGSLEQQGVMLSAEDGEIPVWIFQLQADHLDAADLDRWIGPRARPNWLQRLLPSVLGGRSEASPRAFLRRIRATGELKIDDLTVEKIRLKGFRARLSLAGPQLTVEEAQAQWCGGTAQGRLLATFSEHPAYDVAASFDHVSVIQTPWLAHLSDHLAGTAEGSLKLRASGIGRDALLGSLAGQGELRLSKVELRGWDLPGTMAQGEWKTGVSRWATGAATFHISERGFDLNALRLASPSEEFLVKGSVSFSQDADLTAESHATGRAGRLQEPVRFLTISGPLSEPRVSLERATVQQPGD